MICLSRMAYKVPWLRWLGKRKPALKGFVRGLSRRAGMASASDGTQGGLVGRLRVGGAGLVRIVVEGCGSTNCEGSPQCDQRHSWAYRKGKSSKR